MVMNIRTLKIMMAKMMLLMPLSKYPYEDNDGAGGEDDEEDESQDVKDDVGDAR